MALLPSGFLDKNSQYSFQLSVYILKPYLQKDIPDVCIVLLFEG